MAVVETDSSYAWTRLLVTMAIALVANAGIWVIVVIMPAVEAEFGATRAEVTIPYVLNMIGFAIGNFSLGRAVDKYGVTRTLICAGVTSIAGFGLAIIAQSIAVLALAQLIIGISAAVGFGPLIADISHWFVRRRGIAVALVASGNYLSGALWPLILAGVLEDHGWRTAYGVLAVATFFVVFPLALLLRRKVQAETFAAAQEASTLNVKSSGLSPKMLAWLLAFAGVSCCMAMSMPQVHIVSLCVDLGFGPAVGAEMLSLMLLGGVVSRIISGLVADRLGGVLTLLIGSTLQCFALFLYLPAGGLVSLYVVSTVFGLSQGGIVPSYALIVREYMPAKEAGARVGFVLMATMIGMALGGWVSGQIYVWTGSYEGAFINGIIWNGFNMGIMLWLLLRNRPRGGGVQTQAV